MNAAMTSPSTIVARRSRALASLRLCRSAEKKSGCLLPVLTLLVVVVVVVEISVSDLGTRFFFFGLGVP